MGLMGQQIKGVILDLSFLIIIFSSLNNQHVGVIAVHRLDHSDTFYCRCERSRLDLYLCSSRSEVVFSVTLQGSRHSSGMRALTLTVVKTSGVICVSLRCTQWAGARQATNPLYLLKVGVLKRVKICFEAAGSPEC